MDKTEKLHARSITLSSDRLGLIAPELRTAQYRASFDERTCLQCARGLVGAKIQNCRTLPRRNWERAESSNPVLVDIGADRYARTD